MKYDITIPYEDTIRTLNIEIVLTMLTRLGVIEYEMFSRLQGTSCRLYQIRFK